MKKEVSIIILGIFLLAFIGDVYSLEITVNNPQDGQVIPIRPNSAGKYTDINISTDEEADCSVIPGICQNDNDGGISMCLYFYPQDLSTADSKNHFDNIFIQKYAGYPKQALDFECKDKLNQSYSKEIYFFFNESENLYEVNCGDTINESKILDKDLNCSSNYALTIGDNDITLDCKGHSILSNSKGIFISGKSNINIINCTIDANDTAIMDSSSNTSILNNKIKGYVSMQDALPFIIKNNNFYGDQTGISVLSTGFSSNTLEYDFIIDNNYLSKGDIYINVYQDANYNSVSNNTFMHGGLGISASNTRILNNIFYNSTSSLSAYTYSSISTFMNFNNGLIENNIIKNTQGNAITIRDSYQTNNTIINNTIFYSGINDASSSTVYCLNGIGNFYFEGASGPTCPCATNLTNSTWSDWTNISCLANSMMNQSRYLVQYDLNKCPNYQNKTIFEYRAIEPCCYPNIINSSWNDWANLSSCTKDNKINQSRYKIQYDSNSCNIIQNNTIYEYRQITCNYCSENPNANECIVTLLLNSPKNGSFNSRRLNFDISSNNILTKLELMDSSDRNPRWSILCTKCKFYNKSKNFNDGVHNLTIKGTLSNGQTILNQTSFLIDSRDPQISNIKPQSRRYTNGSDFYIKYTEDNCNSLSIRLSGAQSSSSSCDSGKNIEKYLVQDLSSYNGQEIEYQFIIIDIANNTAESRKTKIKVDTTAPEIKNFKAPISGRYVSFNMTVINEDKNSFNKVEYIDNSESRPRWNSLCTSLKNNNCYKKVYLRTGNHNIIVRALDKAGNSNFETLSFTI